MGIIGISELIYTGVGSRETPSAILSIMSRLAIKLASTGWVLRSGGAQGADLAFESGARKIKYSAVEIYVAADATEYAHKLASRFHPAWSKCSAYAKKLHARNALQILGFDGQNSPEYISSFVVCWTPCGAVNHAERCYETGGTGTAISIANHFNIPVFNLKRPDHFKRISEFAI